MKTETEMFSESFNRLNDAYFKGALASPLRKHITVAFLNAVITHTDADGAEVEDVEFLDREPVPNWEGEKVTRFVVFLRAKFRDNSFEGRLFHIEVQNARDKFFLKRGFYYAGNDYVGQSRRGLSYEEFEPVIFVGLMNFSLKGDEGNPLEWYNLHKVLNTVTHECLFDFMDIHSAELSLLRHKWRMYKHKPSTKFEELLFYFGNVGGKSMGNTLVQEIAERNPTVADLLDFEKEFRSDPLLMRQYVMAQRAHIDYIANMEAEREEGFTEGLEEGREEGIIMGRKEGRAEGIIMGRKEGRAEGLDEAYRASIRNIRANSNMTDEQIAVLLKLPLEFVESV